MKKAIFLSMMLLFGTATGFAEDVTPTGECGDGLTWTLEDGMLIISGTGDMWNYDSGTPSYSPYGALSLISGVVISDGVTSIGNLAFAGMNITSVSIGNSVTKIGRSAFYMCGNLRSAVIPGNVESIGESAFKQCDALSSVTIGEKVTNIGNYAFIYCSNLASITIPGSVESIGMGAFQNCSNLAEIIIGENVTSIGDRAFSGCIPLASVTIPNKVISIGIESFAGCSLTSVTIGKSVTSIGHAAFAYCTSLTSIIIPNSVESIGERAFIGCSRLTSVSTGKNVASIGDGAFENCTGLVTFINLNPVPQNINANVFTGVNLKAATLYVLVNSVDLYRVAPVWKDFVNKLEWEGGATPCDNPIASGTTGNLTWTLCEDSTLTISGEGAMPDYDYEDAPWYSYREAVTTVVIEEGVTRIGDRAFRDCYYLTAVFIPESVTSIGENPFILCSNLTAIDVDNGNLYYSSEDGVLFNKNKTILIRFPENKSGDYTISGNVTEIEEMAFSRCYNLTSVFIPAGVVGIGDYAFGWCAGLTAVTNLNPSPQSINVSVFSGIISNATLYVPSKAVEAYQTAPVWQDFKEILAYVPTAIETPAAESGISIYPNPVTESFRIDGISGKTTVTLTDINGRILLSCNIDGEESVSIAHLSAGMYLVSIQTNERISTHKFIKK